MNARIANAVARLADWLGAAANGLMVLESRVRGYAAKLATRVKVGA